MVFSSLVFLFYFLPITLAAYYLAPARARNAVALVASFIFYAWGAPQVAMLLPFSCWADYAIARRIAAPGVSARAQRGWLALAIALNLALLLYYKYANFAVEQINAVLGWFGGHPLAWTKIELPIGISFFTFQKITYVMDVRRGTARPARNFWDYLLYVLLFPQLIAGPIARYHDVAGQLERRDHTARRFLSGVTRFCVGLARKVLIANPLGEAAEFAFGLDPAARSTSVALYGAACYAFQIYFDFAGYSDMAVGLGRMLGIEYVENFRFPYLARNFTEFWRRWHISLSNFMRDYLYIPLGGNRVAPWRAYVNLWIVFLLSGFWHGAAWSFVVWGAYHGLFLSLDKLLQRTRWSRMPNAIAIPLNFILVTVGWVFFRAESLGGALAYLRALFGGGAAGAAAAVPPEHLVNARTVTALIVAALASVLPGLVGPRARAALARIFAAEDESAFAATLLRFAVCVVLLILSAGALAVSGFNPFIYYRF